MFERGKKDGDYEESADPGTIGSVRDRGAPGNARRGECAVIGRSIRIKGDLCGDEDLRIEGDVSGTVELKNSNLTIGKEGKVRADVYAKSIAVDGTTEGDLYATERVVVHINAQVRGNITAPKVGIEEGARFKGSIEMDPDAVEKALGKAHMQSAAKSAPGRPAGKPGDAPSAPKGVASDVGANPVPPAGAA